MDPSQPQGGPNEQQASSGYYDTTYPIYAHPMQQQRMQGHNGMMFPPPIFYPTHHQVSNHSTVY